MKRSGWRVLGGICALFGHSAGRSRFRGPDCDFARGRRCGRDLIRFPRGVWRPPDRGYRVGWRERA